NSREILVDEAFVKKAKDVMGWDNVVGKEVGVSEHTTYSQGPYYTICGVYENIRLNTISNQDMRPSVTFYKQEPANVLTIKFHELTPEALLQAEQTIQSLITHRDVSLYNWSLSMENLYQNDKRFKDAVTIGSIVALLIALIGLVGYTNDEMNRRRKEVAIRKVNGGELLDVQRIFVVDMLKFALPSVVIGSIASYYLAALWLEQFSEKIALSWYLFASCSMVVVCFVIATLLYKLHSFTHENPINALKSE
ncbi:MAG: ABC transporter permease, partial [Tannerellaceae bacterium]